MTLPEGVICMVTTRVNLLFVHIEGVPYLVVQVLWYDFT